MKFYSSSNYQSDFSILDDNKHSIVSFTLLEDKSGIRVTEECDSHFYTDIKYGEILSLIGKLAVLFHHIKKPE